MALRSPLSCPHSVTKASSLRRAAGGGAPSLAHLGTSASLEPGQLLDKDSQVFPTSNAQDAVSLDPS